MKATAEEIGISEEAYKRLCATFVKKTREDLASLSEAVQNLERESISTLAHHIKGSAANMDFDDLMETAQKINLNASTAPVEEIKRDVERMYTLFAEVEKEIGDNL